MALLLHDEAMRYYCSTVRMHVNDQEYHVLVLTEYEALKEIEVSKIDGCVLEGIDLTDDEREEFYERWVDCREDHMFICPGCFMNNSKFCDEFFECD